MTDIHPAAPRRPKPLTVSAAPRGEQAPAILVRDLRKAYGAHEAVRGLDFEVAAGEVFGLLGPNGAGKTTTVEILEGYRERSGASRRAAVHSDSSPSRSPRWPPCRSSGPPAAADRSSPRWRAPLGRA